MRKLLAPAFTPRALKALQPRIEALVDRLLDRAAAQGGMDLIADFAAAIPLQLIGDMLGVPADERRPLRDWSLAILGALEPVLTAEQLASGTAAVDDFKRYLHGLVERRLREESHDESEILSKLIAATDLSPGGRSDDKLSELELLHNCIFILNAGHETTTNLIGNGVDLLIRNPDAMRDLRANPELIETAVEEFLRVESSNQLGNRRAATDTVLGGVAMPRGTFIHIGIGAANRDPAQFPDPDRSTFAGIPTGTWRSAPASMPARACRSRAWRRRWRSAPWCSASRLSSAPANSFVAVAPASAGFCGIRYV